MKGTFPLHFSYLLVIILAVSSCKDEDPVHVKALFESDRTIISKGETVAFTDQSKGDANKWKWTFDNGNIEESIISTEQHPNITFKHFGKYQVTLEVHNGISMDIIQGTGIRVEEMDEVFSNFASTGTPYEEDGAIISDYQQGTSFNTNDLSEGIHHLASFEFGFKKWTSDSSSNYKIIFCDDQGGYPNMVTAKVLSHFNYTTTSFGTVRVVPSRDIRIEANKTYWIIFKIEGELEAKNDGLWLAAKNSVSQQKRAYRRTKQGSQEWYTTPSNVSSMRITTRKTPR